MRTERKVILLMSLMCFAVAAFAQNQDANPYGGIYYNDVVNQRGYGANGLPRTDHANLDTLTNVLKGDLRFDTLNSVLVYYDGTEWVDVISSGGANDTIIVSTLQVLCDSSSVNQVLSNTGNGYACWQPADHNTLDMAYDEGSAGAGREIVADAGAVKISGTDGLLVTGEKFVGDTIEFEADGSELTVMYFNPRLGAFRAGSIEESYWNEANVGETSFATGQNTLASGNSSTAMGNASTASGDASVALGLETTASGDASLATGEVTTAESYGETATGLFNTDYTPTSTSVWEATDRLFVVGNGQSTGTRSDALVMLKNGNTGLGTSTPDTTLHVVGQMKYVDGNQGEYKYLTSDANGNATWGPDGCFTGWESITDNTNSWTILGGDTVTIAIKRDITVNSQLPCGIDSLWNMTDSTIIGRNGDALNFSLDWVATQNTPNATEFKFWVNIGGAVGIIYPTTYDQNKGNGVAKQYNKTTTVYTLDTWEANGGKIQFTADDDITISDVRLNLFRIHKAR